MSRFAAVAVRQHESLDELRSNWAAGDGLSAILEITCLLELAKLASARPTLARWAESVVEVMPQFFPVDRLVLQVVVADLPTTRASYGPGVAVSLSEEPGPGGSYSLTADDDTVGSMAVVTPLGAHSAAPFLERVAGQLSETLAGVIEAERLRRQVAAAEVVRTAAQAEEAMTEGTLAGLVASLSSLPAVVGASLSVEHPMVGQRLTVDAGADSPHRTHHDLPVAAGRASLTFAWAEPVSPAERLTMQDAVDVVRSMLARAEDRFRLLNEAEVDPLTGCGNRRRAQRALALAFDVAERTGDAFSVLAFDLDDFKAVNDRLGHDVGDDVLCRFAAGLARVCRPVDVPLRMGGEEFLMVLPGTDHIGAARVAQRIRAATPRWCCDALPAGWTQTVSVGVASYPLHADGVTAVLAAADRALYRSKRAGRNTVTV